MNLLNWLSLLIFVWNYISYARGDLAVGTFFQHPDVYDLLLNFTADGAVYTGSPSSPSPLHPNHHARHHIVSPREGNIALTLPVNAFGYIGEVEGMRCVTVRDMSHVIVDVQGHVVGFKRWRKGMDFPVDRRCCRVLDKTVASPVGKSDPDAFSLRCLPTFVIAGSQKSGTTVLAAALAQHSRIAFSSRKELHFFNHEDRYKNGIEYYLKSFPVWNWKDPVFAQAPPIYGEATPAYIAHREVCSRMSHALGPDTRVLLLLREPVARLYSEYQMKVRRVLQQNEFVALADKHAAALYACLDPDNFEEGIEGRGYRSSTRYRPAPWADIKQCVPEELAQHAHWSKFVSAAESLRGGNEDQWQRVLGECFAFSQHKRLTVGKTNESSSGVDVDIDDDDGNDDSRSSDITIRFRPLECLKKHAKEKFKPQEEAFFGEISDFRNCSANITNIDTSLNKLDKAIGRCVKVRKGISGQYVYRSTYVAQLFHCFKSIRREQVLVLPAERLRNAPDDTVAQVVRFLRLTPSEKGATDVSDDGVRSAMLKHFANFERSTGWRLTGEYEPMAPALQSRLRNYFAPLNRRLFDYLGEEFPEWEE